MEIIRLSAGDRKRVTEVVGVHMDCFQGFFLTFLGKGFLRLLYAGYTEHAGSGLLAAVEGSEVRGFMAYSSDVSGFYRFLIKRHLPAFAFYAAGGFLRRPRVFFRLVRALAYPKESRRAERYIELASIGVRPSYSDSGVGTRLIDELKAVVGSAGPEYIKLETDAEGNEKANHFYQKNGFVLHHAYETPEKRKMNEYRFYLGGAGNGSGTGQRA